MKKATKLLLASTITLGALMGAKRFYRLTSKWISSRSNVTLLYLQRLCWTRCIILLNQQFINAVKSDNVKFNGIKLAKTLGLRKLIFMTKRLKV